MTGQINENWVLTLIQASVSNAALAITVAIRDTSREKLYQEVGLQSFQIRLWYRKLHEFLKIFKG